TYSRGIGAGAAPVVADFAGEGRPGLAVSSNGGGRVWVWKEASELLIGDSYADGAEGRIELGYEGDAVLHALRAGDVDGDGLSDLVVAIAGVAPHEGGHVSVFYGRGLSGRVAPGDA